MVTVLSPAKRILPPPAAPPFLTQPLFLNQAATIAAEMAHYSPQKLETLLAANQKLALEAYCAYQDFSAQRPGSAALLSFHGLAFDHLGAAAFESEDFLFAQDHLRIFSALYGLLRPADGILPYRLDLAGKVRLNQKNLYAFWGKKVYEALFEEGEQVLHLASAEYGRLFMPYITPANGVVQCLFLTQKKGRLTTVVTDAKAARGEMARMVIKQRLKSPEQVKEFCFGGFCFDPYRSKKELYVFVRDAAAPPFFDAKP